MITIIAIGKQHDAYIRDGMQRFEKRLQKPFDTTWIYLPHSPKNGASAAEDESERIEKHVPRDAYVILLDERGDQITSPTLAAKLEELQVAGKQVVIVIGGAYGVNAALRQRADFVWSLSQLVFPHQLVRLILVEQLYRAQSIVRGEPYHHM